ncbi:uncharacterized protein DUF1501 [Roseimicrobium gellanilyticum]|uniref:Uncharacterized protein DUF1501 n=1 Tax=Roseimicrobium gellanilyticum TaxID=748857 RepID=A0A366HUA0_9BACT|nr:DUF1501 domain-containing protein [Roseimicrobium gellanilyticum]RBP46484.1 uncharacterized protein DUF1501 [Roseimicrobium gellanilyticum]
MNRRQFLTKSAAFATAPMAGSSLLASSTPLHVPKGKAEHCIFIWLGGGMSQIDTFDPKRRGNPRSAPKVAGSDYASIDTIVPGVRFTEHLSHTAKVADRLTVVRTVNHSVTDEHAFATNMVHTGRMISGTVTYPSIGSLVAHQRGAVSDAVPAYMLIGYPNVSRGPGFLGPRYSSVYLVDTQSGPAGFAQLEGLSAAQVARRRQLASTVSSGTNEQALGHYAELQEQARRWAEPAFMRNFKLDEEPASLREEYGGEFGQRCLLARRLTQAGVRFIEVSHNLNFINGTGWDTHFEGQLNQHLLIQELDVALSALIRDLEKKGLLDKTLIATGTEFGRPAEFDNRGGRGHQGSAFSLVLAGGGLKHRGAYGVTDELGANIVESPVSVPDFHATMYAALGIDPAVELHEAGRPVPITDGGKPIAAMFA